MEFLKTLQYLRTSAGDTFFSVCTSLGSQIVLIFLFSINYWCVDKYFAYEIGTAFFASSLFVQNLKITFRVPRPFVRDPSIIPVESAVEGATGYSFPSGHTQTSTSVLFPAAFEYRKKIIFSVLCVMLILLTGLSRMYLGVHTPEDVVTAFMITVVCSLITMFIRRRFPDKWITVTAAFLAAGTVFSVIYSVILKNQGVIEYKYLTDNIKSAGACAAYALGIILEQKFLKFEPSGKSAKEYIIRLIIGFTGALAFLNGMKLLYKNILILDFLRYFLSIFWIVFIYPLIITKTETRKTHQNA